MMTILLLTALSGLMWGALAHGLEVAHGLRLALFAGTFVGILMGFVIKPFRDADWSAQAALSLVGLYIAVFLFAAWYSAAEGVISGRKLPGVVVLMADSIWSFVWGMTISGWVFVLWPLSVVNHALVWWLQRRHDMVSGCNDLARGTD
jgi:hypothetical protein